MPCSQTHPRACFTRSGAAVACSIGKKSCIPWAPLLWKIDASHRRFPRILPSRLRQNPGLSSWGSGPFSCFSFLCSLTIPSARFHAIREQFPLPPPPIERFKPRLREPGNISLKSYSSPPALCVAAVLVLIILVRSRWNRRRGACIVLAAGAA